MTGKKMEKKEEFESALKKLEDIVEEMEEGALGLEKMMSRFEEGMNLIKLCSAKLNEFERKIEILVKSDDALQTKPFDETNITEPET